MTRPLVSVLIDTYNHERFIEQAIQSVFAQDFPAADREILVVDDGSTDGTAEVLRRFEPQVRVLRKPNGGQASAFNAGIPACRGEIIAFLDGDDWWASGKLRRVVDVLVRDPNVGLVGHGILETFEDGSERCAAPEKPERLRLDSFAAARVFRLRKSYLGTSRMTLRADVAGRILPVPEALVLEADEYLFTLAAAVADIVILQEPLTHYRVHAGNLYLGAGSNPAALRRKQQVHVALVEALQRELPARGVPREAVECLTEIIAAEADQMRLMLDGGTPWETVQTERKIYNVLHGDAPLSHRLFREATMLPAWILPPKWFYAARRWLASQTWYAGIRKKVLPVPGVTHVAGPEEFKA
jgi:hypothetical protein